MGFRFHFVGDQPPATAVRIDGARCPNGRSWRHDDVPCRVHVATVAVGRPPTVGRVAAPPAVRSEPSIAAVPVGVVPHAGVGIVPPAVAHVGVHAPPAGTVAAKDVAVRVEGVVQPGSVRGVGVVPAAKAASPRIVGVGPKPRRPIWRHVTANHGTATQALGHVAKIARKRVASARVHATLGVVPGLFKRVGQVLGVRHKFFVSAEVQFIVLQAGKPLRRRPTPGQQSNRKPEKGQKVCGVGEAGEVFHLPWFKVRHSVILRDFSSHQPSQHKPYQNGQQAHLA